MAAMQVRSLPYVERSLDSSNQWRPWCEHSSQLLTDTTHDLTSPEVDWKQPAAESFHSNTYLCRQANSLDCRQTWECGSQCCRDNHNFNTASIPLWKIEVNIEFPEQSQLSPTLLCKLKFHFSMSSRGYRVCTDSTWVWTVKRRRKSGSTETYSLSDSTLQQSMQN